MSLRELHFTVEDSGTGIDPVSISQLFKNFTKIMKNRELNRQGCGLGLNISKSIANALGGDITVKSTEGVGS